MWGAAGVYGQKQNDKSFIVQLKSNVTVRGGFACTETSADEADPGANVTIFTPDGEWQSGGPFDDWRMDAAS